MLDSNLNLLLNLRFELNPGNKGFILSYKKIFTRSFIFNKNHPYSSTAQRMLELL